MKGRKFWKRGISPLLATVILIAITVAAGLTIYTLYFSTFSTVTASLDIQVISIDIVKASGTMLVSATIKNTGNKPIDTCTVTIYGDTGTAELTINDIDPGEFGSDSKTGSELSGFSVTIGNSYPVKIHVEASDGSKLDKSLSVMCVG